MIDMRKQWVIVALSVLVTIGSLLTSCSTSPDGNEPTNSVPVIQIVNIPESGTHFTTSPVISWFGTDADGYIVSYDYAVIRADIVEAAVDVSDEAAVRAYARAQIQSQGNGATCDPACWTVINVATVDSPTRQSIRLIAGDTPEDTVRQYFFVRAVDDDGDPSIIDYSLYSRSNNPPVTEILTVPDPAGVYDAPDTLGTYKGIVFDWKGTDRLDFPNEADQPDFEYFYQVFGPYARADLNFDTTTGRIADGAGIDTLATAKLVLSSQNTETGFGWVGAKSTRLFNLHRWVPTFTTTRDDYFVLKVTTRDDAKASDPTPEYRIFRVIVPRREKPILLWAPPFCQTRFRPGNVPCDSYDTLPNFPVPPGSYSESDVIDYYKRILTSAGYPEFTLTRTMPTRRQIAEYALVLMLFDGDFKPVSDRKDTARVFADLNRYLDFGGRVWLWSPQPLSAFYDGSKESMNSFRINSTPALYYSILAEYRAAWEAAYIKRTGWGIHDLPYPITQEQFTGALALPGNEFTDIDLDQDKLQNTYIMLKYSTEIRDNYPLAGPPATSYFIRSITGQPLFIYRSAYGSILPDSVSRWIEGHQGTVVAVRTFNEKSKFKTAVFGFPAWPLVEEQAVDLTRKMLDWFFAE